MHTASESSLNYMPGLEINPIVILFIFCLQMPDTCCNLQDSTLIRIVIIEVALQSFAEPADITGPQARGIQSSTHAHA